MANLPYKVGKIQHSLTTSTKHLTNMYFLRSGHKLMGMGPQGDKLGGKRNAGFDEFEKTIRF